MSEPRLYIIMRENLWDMNPGKGMAQAAHAQADFDDYLISAMRDKFLDKEIVSTWKEDRKFGTTLVLSVPNTEWDEIKDNTKHWGFVEDPTYPYKNWYGKVFTTYEETCMWVFATTDEEINFMKKYPLHP